MVLFAFTEVGEDDELAEDVASLRAEVESCKVHGLLGLVRCRKNTIHKEAVHASYCVFGLVAYAVQSAAGCVLGNLQKDIAKVFVYCGDVGESVFGHDTNILCGIQSRLAQGVPGGAWTDGDHPAVAGQVFGFSQSESVFTAQEFLGAACVGLCERGGGHGCQGNQNGSNDALEHGVLLRTWVLEGTSGLLGHEDLMYII